MIQSGPTRPGLLLVAPALAGMVGYAAVLSPGLTVLALGAACALVLAALRAELILIGFVAMMPWEGLLVGSVPFFTPTRLAGVLLLAAWAYRAAAGRVQPVPRAFVPLLVLLLAVAASVLLNDLPPGSIDTAFRWVAAISFFFFAVQLVDTRKQAETVLAVYAASSAIAAGWALYLFLTDRSPDVSGPIQNPLDFALLLGGVLPILLYFAASATDRLARFAWSFAAAVTFAAAVGTLSRGALTAATVVVIWALLARHISIGAVLRGLVAAVIAAAVVYSLNPDVADTALGNKSRIAGENVSSRESFWSAALEMSADYPVAGIGPGQFDARRDEYVIDDPTVAMAVGTLGETSGVHNTYLSALVEVGPVALAGFVVFVAEIWLLLSGAMRRARRSDTLIAALQAALLFAAVASLFIAVQYEVHFWLIGAMAVVVVRELENDPRRAAR